MYRHYPEFVIHFMINDNSCFANSMAKKCTLICIINNSLRDVIYIIFVKKKYVENMKRTAATAKL